MFTIRKITSLPLNVEGQYITSFTSDELFNIGVEAFIDPDYADELNDFISRNADYDVYHEVMIARNLYYQIAHAYDETLLDYGLDEDTLDPDSAVVQTVSETVRKICENSYKQFTKYISGLMYEDSMSTVIIKLGSIVDKQLKKLKSNELRNIFKPLVVGAVLAAYVDTFDTNGYSILECNPAQRLGIFKEVYSEFGNLPGDIYKLVERGATVNKKHVQFASIIDGWASKLSARDANVFMEHCLATTKLQFGNNGFTVESLQEQANIITPMAVWLLSIK